MGLLERHGEVRTMVVSNTKRKSLQSDVNRHVEAGSTVYSDALRSYRTLGETYIHNVINHLDFVEHEPKYQRAHRSEFYRVADCWLIAHAHADKGTVVTHETERETGKIKVSSVCSKMNELD